MKINISASLAITALLAAQSAQAATLYYDGDGTTTTGNGWGTASFWSTDLAGTTDPPLAPLGTDDVIFSITGAADGVVGMNAARAANSLTFSSSAANTLMAHTTSTTANSLTIGAGGITINSGAGAVTFGVGTRGVLTTTLGASQLWTHDGGNLFSVTQAVTLVANTLTLAGSGTGGTTLSGVISGTSAVKVNRSGSGVVTLGGANSFTGQLSVERGVISIASINNVSVAGVLGNSALPVILGSSGSNTGTLSYTGGNASTTKKFTLAAGGTGVIDVTNAATTLTLTDVFSSGGGGEGNLTKAGAGRVVLNVSGGNYGTIAVPQYTGVTKITGGILQFQGGNSYQSYNLFNSAYDTTGSTGGTIGLKLDGFTGPTTTPWFGGLAGDVNLATAIVGGYTSAVTAVGLNVHSGKSYSYDAIIANGAAGGTSLTKQGYGTQIFTDAQAYTGTTLISAGTLSLGGANGSILTSSGVTVRGGTLELDNSTDLVASRLADGTALSLGSLTLKGRDTGGVQTETVGNIAFATGGKVTINNGTTLGDQTTLAMGTVTRSAGAAIDFVGTNGTLGSGANSPNVTSTGAFPNISNGILGWATVGGTQWAENNSGSIRAYSGTFVDPTSAPSDASTNAQLIGSGSMTSKSFNSLNVISGGAGQNLDLGGAGVLTLNTNGGILKSGATDYEIKGSATSAITAGAALNIHVDGGELTISAKLNTAILGLAKGGTGNLILSGTRAGTMSGAIGIAGGNLEFRGATTLLTGVISGSGGLTANLNAGQILTINNTGNSYSGPTLAKGGILRIGTAYNAQGLPGGNSGQYGISNLEINNAIVSIPYYVSMGLGDRPGQFQITGGTAGFSGYGNDAIFNVMGTSNYEVVWGAANEAGNALATGYFNPSVFVFGDSTSSGAIITWNNGIDLNGATRTISNSSTSWVSTITGIIRNSTGTAGLVKEGVGMLVLSNASSGWNGSTTISAGILDFAGNTLASVGGGSGRNITVAAGAGVKFNALSNALLNRLAENSNEIAVMSGATANSFDFGSSTGANLPNAFLGNWAGNGAKAEISGTITPGSDGYKFGAKGSNGLLGIRGLLGGANDLTVGMTGAGGIRVNIVAANTHTGETVINTGSRLTLGHNLALQNSALNVGSAGGNFSLAAGTNAGRISGETPAPSPTFGGLIGSRSLYSVFSNAGGNNETNLANTDVTGFTLNVGTGLTHTYSGAIGGFGTGAGTGGAAGTLGNSTLTKTGLGTQILSGPGTYTGTTNVSGGTLLINGTHTGGGLITVEGGATLGGSGTMGDVTVDNLGILAPGTSPGQITVGPLTLNDTSVLAFELGAPNLGQNPASDHIQVNGNLTLDGKLQVTDIAGFPGSPLVGDKWLLLSYSGTLTDNTLVVDSAPGGPYVIDTDTSGSVFLVAAVPEAGTAGLLALGLLLLRRLRRGRAA